VIRRRDLRIVPVLIVAALALPLGARADGGAPLTADAEVVILTGLPGDVESEIAYRRQTERLLEVLALAAAPPRRVFVLNDAEDAGTVPPGLDVTVGEGTRQGVLDLAVDAPLTVFVWGHGGLIGRDPVFHVRGPRLQPADLATLAGRVAGPSRWVLLFRHSGAFARALRAPGREVLASEDAAAFKSDPISMDLLLEILREEPGLSLAALAERLGPATLAWYEAQQLARQEEPTLWLGAAPPRRLADAEPELAAAPPAAPVAAAWEGVEPVDAADYPGASAVVLRRTLGYVLAGAPAYQEEVDEYVQILTGEGAVHADFDVAFHPPEEKITFLDCEVRRPDGTLERLAPEAIRDATPAALPEYRPPTRKVFSLPHAVPGAILRVHYRREWRRFPLPHVPLEIPLAGDLPVKASRIAVTVARDAPFHWTFHRHPSVAPEVSETTYGTAHAWSFRDLGPATTEALASPQASPRLLVSTFPSWEEFSGWYRRLVRLADELTPEVAAKAAELTAGTATEREKVAALYDFVTGLRYVAVPIGVNSHRPHAAADVFANRYGDCKDKANLFNTMLRAVGVDADLVLVPRFSQAYEATPGLGFNHAISRVRLGEEVIWADTTDDVARFGLLPPGDPGRNVLVIDEHAAALTPLPVPEPADHVLTLKATIELPSSPPFEKGGLGGIFSVTTTGFPDYVLRSLARAHGSGNLPLALTYLQPVNGYFAMTGQRFTPPAALDRDFEWHGEGSWTGLVVPVGESVLVRAPFLLPSEWSLALHERTTPLYLNRGYPLTLTQDLTFVLPEGTERPRFPEASAGDRGPLRWRVEWRLEGARVRAVLEVVLAKGELDWEETVAFREELRRLYEVLGLGALTSAPRRRGRAS